MTFRFGALLCASLMCIGINPIQADEFSDNFQNHLNQTNLDALAQDLGAVVGGGSFHQGKALGFPIGFDLGVHVPVVRVQDDNLILSDNKSSIPAVWGQFELGLPRSINVIGRAGQVFDADMIGGGLRWGLLNPALPGGPAFSLIGLYNQVDHEFFEATVISLNAVLSVDLPFVRPFLGAGFDTTKLEPTAIAFSNAAPSISRDLEGESEGTRVEAGINVSIIPFTYISLGAGFANDGSLYHIGTGARF